MNPVFNIGLGHFVIVSFLLAAAGVATLLTKRNAIGILIGVELILNAAAINFVAFNRYSHPAEPATAEVVAARASARDAMPRSGPGGRRPPPVAPRYPGTPLRSPSAT